jgi:hypothetical protein
MKAADVQQLNNEISGSESKKRITYIIKMPKRKITKYKTYF